MRTKLSLKSWRTLPKPWTSSKQTRSLGICKREIVSGFSEKKERDNQLCYSDEDLLDVPTTTRSTQSRLKKSGQLRLTIAKLTPFRLRLHVPRQEGFTSLKPSKPLHERLDVRQVSLTNRGASTTTWNLAKTNSQNEEEWKLLIDTHKRSGKDAMLVFHFLTRMVTETDKLLMTEDRAYILLPNLLSNPAAT